MALTKDNQVILARQFRPGPNEILNELPGGYIDKDETPEQAAERELLEETGYSGDFEFIGTCFDCAYSTMERYCFVARNCKKVQEPDLDETEFVKVEEITLKEIRALLRSGKMTDNRGWLFGIRLLRFIKIGLLFFHNPGFIYQS